MKKIAAFAAVLFLFISANRSQAEGFFYQVEDPKSYLTHIRFQYNTTWQVNEIEAKVSKNLTFFQLSWFSIGFMGNISIYLHPTDNFWGYYPVDNLIGCFAFYSELTNFGVKDLSIQLYPVAHESSHLVDGYNEGTKNLYTDKFFDSNEYTGFDLRYAFGGLKLYAGFIYYLYLGNKTTNSVARPLIFRVHAGEDFIFPVIPETMNLILSSDFALFYENRYHTAVNIGIGLDFDRFKLMFHYENQYGLGQDFNTLQNRLGLEFTLF
jgi:hypothetical protein